jgi:hypothetical protein
MPRSQSSTMSRRVLASQRRHGGSWAPNTAPTWTWHSGLTLRRPGSFSAGKLSAIVNRVCRNLVYKDYRTS